LSKQTELESCPVRKEFGPCIVTKITFEYNRGFSESLIGEDDCEELLKLVDNKDAIPNLNWKVV